MLDTLEKMSGKTHVTYTDSKMVTRDEEKPFLRPFLRNSGAVSYTRTTVEEPVISYNNLAFLPERNSIMFIASNPCVWNRNETILPMSWRLYGSHTIKQPGHTYTLQTIPTLSTAMDFDARANQPDFEVMLETRIAEAHAVRRAKELYQSARKLTDLEVTRLDEDVYASAVMDIVDELVAASVGAKGAAEAKRKLEAKAMANVAKSTPNTELEAELKEQGAKAAADDRAIYAKGTLSRSDLVGSTGHQINHQFDDALIRAFMDVGGRKLADTRLPGNVDESGAAYFAVRRADGGLMSPDGQTQYIKKPKTRRADADAAARGAADPNSRVMADHKLSREEIIRDTCGWIVTDDFIRLLASFDTDWPFAGGAYKDRVQSIWVRQNGE